MSAEIGVEQSAVDRFFLQRIERFVDRGKRPELWSRWDNFEPVASHSIGVEQPESVV